MIDYHNVAKRPARFIIYSYSIIQALIYILFDIENTHYRLITSVILILLGFFVTKIKKLPRLHLSIIVPLSIAAVEIISVSLFLGGNRTIFIFLIGCSLVSLLYVNFTGLLVMILITSTAVGSLIFVFDIRLLDSALTRYDEMFNYVAMVFIFVVILVFGKYSIGMLSRSQRTEHTFNKVLEESSGLIVIVNNQAKVEYISKSFAEILNIDKQEYAINLPFVDLFPNIELKYFFGELLERDGIIETTFDIITKNENEDDLFAAENQSVVRSFMLHSIPMRDKGIARFFDCVEITPIIESQRTAEAATRSKSEFLAMMSHEIRTPLNAIIGISQIQLEDSSLPARYATAQEKIFSSGKNLLGIINDILDMSRIETGKLHFNIMEYDVPSLINDTIQLNIVRIGSKPIEFLLDINGNLPSKLYGDELRIKQVLNNLLSNAIKYTEKGHVRLSIRHALVDKNVYLIIKVEDTGQGMKSEDKKHLFTEYTRFNAEANRNTEGTGLGLNITQKLVEMMDGQINVESEWGKGSIFTVTIQQNLRHHEHVTLEYIPIGEDLAQRLCDFTFSSEKQAYKQLITRVPMPYGSVLIVDDVDTNIYVAEGLLKPYMLNIESANSGFAAIDMIKSGKNYDVIFMDHMMPVMDGIETTQYLRELGYSGIIVALTANALTGNDEMFIQKGFDGFIPKPIDIKLLNTALNKFIRDKYPEEAIKYKPETAIENDESLITPRMIQVFCRDAEKAINKLREITTAQSNVLPDISGTEDNIKLFTTTVHAMKSALWNIGEKEKSDMASALEEAGLKNDVNFIKENIESFIITLEELKNKFYSCLPQENTKLLNESIQEDTIYLTEQLQIVKTACVNYNITAAINALEQLKDKSWKYDTYALIEKIYDMLDLNSDFEGVINLIS